MRATTCFLLVLAAASCTQATVRVFVTTSSDGYGLENPANHMVPTASTVYSNGSNENAYDYADYDGNPGPIRPGPFPPANAPSGTPESPVLIAPGDWAYVWFQIQNFPNGTRFSELDITVRYLDAGVAPVATTYYLCNNLQSAPGQFGIRWDGPATPPEYPEWHNNPQYLIAITAFGVQNVAYSLPWNLWNGAARIALLGAVEAPADGAIYQVDLDASPILPTVSTAVFRFVAESCPGDLNCDGDVNFLDINPFVMYMSDYATWEQWFPSCNPANGDIDGDGTYPSFGDINPFVNVILEPGGCP